MKKKKKHTRKPIAPNLLVPAEREDGTYDMSAEGLSSLHTLIMNKIEEMMITSKLFNYMGALTNSEKAKIRRQGARIFDYYEEGRKAWLDYNRRVAMRLLANAFNDLRKTIIQLNEFGGRAQYYKPEFYYGETVGIPEPTEEEIHLLYNLMTIKVRAWHDYWNYVHNIGFAFKKIDEWFYLTSVRMAMDMRQRAIVLMQANENPYVLRVEFMTAIYYITQITDHLWDFTDPEGAGYEQLDDFSMAAYAEYTQQQMERRQPLGPIREILPQIQAWGRAKGYLEPGGEPVPPPNFERFEVL